MSRRPSDRYVSVMRGVLVVAKDGSARAMRGYTFEHWRDVLARVERDLVKAFPDDVERTRTEVAAVRAAAEGGQDVSAQLVQFGMLLGETEQAQLVRRRHSRQQSRRRQGKFRIPPKTRRRIVNCFDSADRQSENWLPFIRRAFPDVSDPTIRSILREAKRIPPAKPRK